MTVNGSLVFASAAQYMVFVDASDSSFTHVNGTATLNGTVVANVNLASPVTKTYLILETTSGFGATRFSGSVINNSNFLHSLSYIGDDVFLDLSPQLGVGAPNLTQNQRNVDNAVNSVPNSGGTLPPAFGSLFGLGVSNLANALDQLSGEAATGAQQAAFQLGDQFLNVMLDPFVDGRCGIGGTDRPPLGYPPDCQEVQPAAPARGYFKAPAMYTKAPPLVPQVYEPHWSVWGTGYGGGSQINGDPVIGSHDLSARTAGFAGGFDYRFSPNSVVGFALAGGGTNWSLSQGLGGGRSDALQVARSPGAMKRRAAATRQRRAKSTHGRGFPFVQVDKFLRTTPQNFAGRRISQGIALEGGARVPPEKLPRPRNQPPAPVRPRRRAET
jgi:hypothetical protein